MKQIKRISNERVAFMVNDHVKRRVNDYGDDSCILDHTLVVNLLPVMVKEGDVRPYFEKEDDDFLSAPKHSYVDSDRTFRIPNGVKAYLDFEMPLKNYLSHIGYTDEQLLRLTVEDAERILAANRVMDPEKLKGLDLPVNKENKKLTIITLPTDKAQSEQIINRYTGYGYVPRETTPNRSI